MQRRVSPFACLLSAAIAAAPGIAAGADDAAEGGRIVKQRCLACHNQEKLAALAVRSPAAERVGKWERFLPGHYLPKAEERAAVIAWLKDNTGP